MQLNYLEDNMKKTPKISAIAALTCAALLPGAVLADPPDHAPAHGWRKKHDPNYVGYTGKKWDRDYGVVQGRCNTGDVGAAVGAMAGGAIGGAIGSQVGKGDGRTIAILVGTAVGAVIGAKIGREVDSGDRACIGHALELAGARKTVVWSNEKTGATYRLTPTRGYKTGNLPCRDFTTVMSAGGTTQTVNASACRRADGEWELRS
jgi:surface antigen